MTSGNVRDEPICIADEEAHGGWPASPIRVPGEQSPHPYALRRFGRAADQVDEVDGKPGTHPVPAPGRGSYTLLCPCPVAAEGAAPAEGVIFAAGPEQKNTFTLLRGTDGFVSQHIGDVENAEPTTRGCHEGSLREPVRNGACGGGMRLAPRVPDEQMGPSPGTSCDRGAASPCPHCVGHGRARADRRSLRHRLRRHGLWRGWGHLGNGECCWPTAPISSASPTSPTCPCLEELRPSKHPLRMAYGVLWAYDLLEHPAAAVAWRLWAMRPRCATP